MSDARPGAVARRAGSNLARAARRLASRAALPREGGAWLLVRLPAALDELARPHLPFGPGPALGLLDVLSGLDAARADPRVAGVVVRFGARIGGLSRAQSLRRALARVRESGKPVVAWAESWDAESLLAASAATRVYLPESGSVLLVGLRFETLHVKHLLDRFEVAPHVMRVGRHKTAGERLTRERMSPEDREQLEALADDLFEALVEALAAGRGLDAAAVRDRIDRGPYSAAAAAEAGLVDGCRYPDEVERELPELAPGTARDERGRPRRIEVGAYHALFASDPGWRPLLRELPRLAYVVARGAIHRGGGQRGIACDPLRELLETLRTEERVRGVVLRLDTGGGDGVASDLLWRAVSRLAHEKPVVASMGDVAASGGYYVAAAADTVFAEAATVTGSIGVVGGKLDLGGLYRRVGVSKDAVERGARAGLLSDVRGFTGDERAAVQALFEAAHDTFVDRVARGRGLPAERVAQLAGGRVWSGVRARALGLVDALGGPLEALAEARRRAGLREGDRVLLDLHPRLPRLPGLLGLARRLPGRTASW
jgi:protease-4